MAVYSTKMDGDDQAVQVTRRFKVFDMVEISLRDGKSIKGEIVFIEEENIYVTGPYMPIKIVRLREIDDIVRWNPPENWK